MRASTFPLLFGTTSDTWSDVADPVTADAGLWLPGEASGWSSLRTGPGSCPRVALHELADGQLGGGSLRISALPPVGVPLESCDQGRVTCWGPHGVVGYAHSLGPRLARRQRPAEPFTSGGCVPCEPNRQLPLWPDAIRRGPWWLECRDNGSEARPVEHNARPIASTDCGWPLGCGSASTSCSHSWWNREGNRPGHACREHLPQLSRPPHGGPQRWSYVDSS
mmetsp:Transcript_55933/g.121059  ORF Transcript_55933/g.121059 Transcript_55933/m.121059 type:complete len:222 (+) Transcript_55933:1879-2544(+)